MLVYGSALSELATPSSDLDLCLSLPNVAHELQRDEQALHDARDALHELGQKVRGHGIDRQRDARNWPLYDLVGGNRDREMEQVGMRAVGTEGGSQ